MRKSVSTAFFSLVSTLMVLGIVLMGASEWVLFKNYFAKDRYETLDQVVGVTQRTAQYLAQQAALPEGDELDALSTKLEIIGESAEAYLFFTDNDGNVMIASSPDKLEADAVPGEMMEKIDASGPDYYHVFGTLDGVLTADLPHPDHLRPARRAFALVLEHDFAEPAVQLLLRRLGLPWVPDVI